MGASVLSAKFSRKSPGVTVGALGHADPYSTAAVTPRSGHEKDAATEASYTASIAHGTRLATSGIVLAGRAAS
jgi:hypothetical protein